MCAAWRTLVEQALVQADPLIKVSSTLMDQDFLAVQKYLRLGRSAKGAVLAQLKVCPA